MVFVVLLVFIAVGGVIATRRLYSENLKPVNISSKERSVFVIASGSSVDTIATSLHDQKLIRSTTVFKQYVNGKDLGESFKAGTYRLGQYMSVSEIVSILTEGKVAVDLFTILPGRRLDQIRQDFIDGGFAAEAVDKSLNPANYSGHPALVDKPAGATLEGYLYPDSFQKTADTDPGIIIAASLDEMNSHLTTELRSAYAAEGLTTYKAITLASVIEKEVSTQSDRNTAAQVFFSRIKQGMRLQSDVTVLYGLALAGKDTTLVDTSFDSPYNTFLHDGLPAGPIANVTKSGLEAVAHPSNTDYLYFVAGDDGVTYFSKTQAEHESLANQHCKKLCGRE
jgi:UPF0755 protein